MPVKQVIVIRKDLKMRRGKEIAQGAHASMKVILNYLDYKRTINNGNTPVYELEVTSSISEWLDGIFTKVVVYVESEEELLSVYEKAKEAGLPCSLIKDRGLTEFHNVPTYTCVGIGPDESSKIDKITGNLSLY